jgi:DNA invertase Pin-like site-specific DNA recombinase
VNFTSIKDSIDTSTVQGRVLLNIFGSLAEFERDTIRERTKAALSAAKARGWQKEGIKSRSQEKSGNRSTVI